MMKVIIFFISVMFAMPAAAEPVTVVIGPEFWMSPRYGETIIKWEPLEKVVHAYLDAEGEARLRISYPATESGELWGGELQAWLVSLGIASDRIERRADATHDDAVEVSLVSVTESVHVPAQGKDKK